MPDKFTLEAIESAFEDSLEAKEAGLLHQDMTFYDYFAYRLTKYGYKIVEEGK